MLSCPGMGGNRIRQALKALAWSGAAVALAALMLFMGAVWLGERKAAREVDVRVVPVPFAKDAASLRLGRYLFEARGCAGCHAADGHGLVVVDDAGVYVKSPNITKGLGGVVAEYAEADWVRAVRHGVGASGHALLAMPSEDYSRMSDRDFAALVAYARSLPPVAGGAAEIHMPLAVTALYGVGLVRDASEKIDHRLPPAPAVAPAPNAEYGAYVIQMCVGCHRPDLSGGPVEGAPPGWPPAARLAPGAGSAMARYDTPQKFSAMMRSGKRPDGSAVSDAMPFATLRNLDDTDLGAMYAYIAALSAR
ncbi:MAG TPA: c-type cytochrome [Usitatibacter sp.]|nr:c-type cytochrome [Usitatibacter sp.]